jgi:hypothetical protein
VCLATAGAGEVVLKTGVPISVEAEGSTLREVLVAVSNAVPLSVIERGEPPQEPVSLTVEARTWHGFFRKLLGSESHLLTLHGDTGTPKQLVVRWDAVRRNQPALPVGEAAEGTDDIEARIRAVADDVLAPPDRAGEAIANAEKALDAFEAATDGPNETDAREAYLEALGDLHTFDEARTVQALVPALELYDREARMAGLEMLRGLSHTGRTSAAVEAAINVFATADDDAVQRAALEVLVRYGDQNEVMRLLEPLALADGPNRDIAVREWIRIREEQIAHETAARTGDPQLRRSR